jgi:hypothetical protein
VVIIIVELLLLSYRAIGSTKLVRVQLVCPCMAHAPILECRPESGAIYNHRHAPGTRARQVYRIIRLQLQKWFDRIVKVDAVKNILCIVYLS